MTSAERAASELDQPTDQRERDIDVMTTETTSRSRLRLAPEPDGATFAAPVAATAEVAIATAHVQVDDAAAGELASITPISATDNALKPTSTRHRLMVADAATALVGLAVAVGITLLVRPMAYYTLSRHLLATVASLPAFAFGAVAAQLYRARANERQLDEIRNIAKTVVAGTSFLVILAFVFQINGLSRLWVGMIAVGVFGALVIERSFARRIFARLRLSGRMRRKIVIVGTDNHAVQLHQLFAHDPSLGYEVVGFVGDVAPDLFGDRLLGGYDDVEQILFETSAVGVVMSPASVRERKVNSLTRTLTDAGYHVAISSSLHDIDITRLRPQSIDGRSVLYVEPVARSGAPLLAKRLFDVVAAASLLVATAPITLAAMLAIKLTSRGPVLFRQERIGRDGKPFPMMKLRTMVVDAEDQLDELASLNEADGPLFKIGDDPRVTPVGRFLRRASIDELPQLVAVLRGTMSMVGPRPALAHEVAEWDEATRERLRVLPGLTGLWQVSGRSDASFDVYKRLDLFYVHNWSIRHDVTICLRTVAVVLGARGAR